jgi:hypothetical protein
MDMKIIRLRALLATTALILLAAQRASAQAPLEPEQMPASTAFYFVWRGQPAAELRKTNSIAALWDDPGFSPVRSAITKALLKNSEGKRETEASASSGISGTSGTSAPSASSAKGTEAHLTKVQLDEYATLLENPFVVGYLSDPNKRPVGAVASVNGRVKPAWNGMFLVYDRTGKEALLTKAVMGLRASEKEIPQISQVTIADVAVLKIQRKSSVTYWAENGKYAVSANENAVMQEILSRLNGSGGRSGGLGETAAYQEAQSLLGSGLGSGPVEFFLRVPNLKELAADSKAGVFSARPILDAIKLEAIHSLSGRMTLEGARSRLQINVLGDTAPGSLFDIWDQGAAEPAALEFMPAEAVSFSDTQINLQGLYETVQRITRTVLPAGAGDPDMFESMAQAKLGQPISSALALFTGELASVQTSPSLDSAKQLYVVGIRNKPETLKLLHTVISDRITSERSEGDTTFLKISAQGGQVAAGTAQWNFYHAALTPHFLVAANRLETVRELLAKKPTAASAGLSASAEFRTARAQFPAQINGLGYFDFRKLDWRAMKERMIAEARKTSSTAGTQGAAVKTHGAKTTRPAAIPEWIMEMNPEVFARHLHVASSASWKDTRGLHFDQWIE